jgi:hypothetical protein
MHDVVWILDDQGDKRYLGRNILDSVDGWGGVDHFDFYGPAAPSVPVIPATPDGPKVGDKILVTVADASFFLEGEHGVLDRRDAHGNWWADFNGNPRVEGGGFWCIADDSFVVVPPVTAILKVKVAKVPKAPKVTKGSRKGYSLPFKRLVSEEYLSTATVTYASVALHHGISCSMVYKWVAQYRSGVLTADFAVAFSKRPKTCKGKLAALGNLKRNVWLTKRTTKV